MIPVIPPPQITTPVEKKDVNRVTPPSVNIPDRENLPIYRPFTRVTPTPSPNDQYQMKFDTVTGR